MSKSEIPAKVYIVGAGPGDPELLTRRAEKLINKATVILHDHLVSPEILALANADCKVMSIGKRAGDGIDQNERQQRIIELLEKYASEGEFVVRLKGGDPMIFGRGAEEYEALILKGIEVEIVPGITSGIAAGSLALLPLTERGRSEGLLLLTGHTLEGNLRNPELLTTALLSGNSIILYMAHKKLEQLVKIVLESGIDSSLPVAVISSVSTGKQESLISTISEVIEDVEKSKSQRPMLFILGKHIRELKINKQKK